jgi:hypothetical protein
LNAIKPTPVKANGKIEEHGNSGECGQVPKVGIPLGWGGKAAGLSSERKMMNEEGKKSFQRSVFSFQREKMGEAGDRSPGLD